MGRSTAVVRGVGIVSPVGLDALQTAAAVRAGISRRAATTILDKLFEPIVMGLVPDEHLPALEPSVQHEQFPDRLGRMLRLATPPLRELASTLTRSEEVPILVGLPEATELPASLATEAFLRALSAQAGARFHPRLSRTFPAGRASGIIALEHAMELMTRGDCQQVAVGGVDTYYDASVLEPLDKDDRLLTTNVADGFIPGEAAAFMVIDGGKPSRTPQTAPLARIVAVGTGSEQGHLYSSAPYTGSGLAAAFQSLFEGWETAAGSVRTILAGFNGENFGAKEWGVAYLRNHDKFFERPRLLHPVDCLGDPGAALGPLLLGVGALGLNKRYLEGPCLVFCSSDREPRGAAVLAAA